MVFIYCYIAICYALKIEEDTLKLLKKRCTLMLMSQLAPMAGCKPFICPHVDTVLYSTVLRSRVSTRHAKNFTPSSSGVSPLNNLPA